MGSKATVLFKRARKQFARHDGFTLVELLIVMIIMMVVMVAVYSIWFGLQRTYSFTDEDMTAQEQARSALTEVVQSIRTARQPDFTIPESLDMVIVSADANSLICWTDTDRDPLHQLELVRFWVDSATRTLYRERDVTSPYDITYNPSAPPPYNITLAASDTTRLIGNWVSNNASTPLFSYISANGTVLPAPVEDPTQIREVAIDLRIDVYTEKAPIAHQLRSMVQPRNLRQY